MEEWEGGEALPDYFEDYDTIGGGGVGGPSRLFWRLHFMGCGCVCVCVWGGGALSDFEDYYSPYTPSIYI